MAKPKQDAQPPGPAVDAAGRTVVDPTANVIALTEAAVKRLDDIRVESGKQIQTEFERVDAALQHVTDIVALRAEHAQQLSALETSRLNAIRQVDVLAVSTAADRAQAAIQALAAVTTTNAENLRNALNTTATTIATQLANTVAGLVERLAALEKSSYTGLGKQAVADPQMADLIVEMRKLSAAGSANAGKSAGLSMGATVLIGVVTLVVGMLTIYATLKH